MIYKLTKRVIKIASKDHNSKRCCLPLIAEEAIVIEIIIVITKKNGGVSIER